ncbi:MAG: ABC transporter ATP-binding protein [Clostridia bacterium]|nr:ABC transporter ATP-binding protein [Clostridia bacterium]
MITVNLVEKSYRNGDVEHKVLKGISLTIETGEFVVLLGPSGSGKSTFLNCISGLERIDRGSVCYDGTDITRMKERELTAFRRKKTAFVFQAYYLMPSLTAEMNVRMGANLVGKKDVVPLLEAVGLKGKEKKYPSQLSGGEQQRVSIARAIAKEPEVLFADEPTGALDEETGRNMLRYLIALQRERKITLVMVTHNENIACLADRIVRMNSGRIISDEKNSPKTVDEIGW